MEWQRNRHGQIGMKAMGALFFEDFEVGQKYVSPARTITETDVIIFAQLSGDFNPVHTDFEVARSSQFGQPIAHGLLGLSVLTGLMARTGLFDGTVIALLGIEEWKFKLPIAFGDTVHTEIEIVRKRLSRTQDRGVVIRRCSLVNQRNDITQEGTLPVLVRCKKVSKA